MSTHVLSLLVEDKPGLLTRVAGLFARRGFNIESLAVGHSEIPGLSRITVVVDVDGVAVACGGLRPLDGGGAEVKRLYVAPQARGRGVSTAVLRAIEDEARGMGLTRLVLETGSAQPDAMRFYEREGYTRIPNFGHYADSAISLCYARDL